MASNQDNISVNQDNLINQDSNNQWSKFPGIPIAFPFEASFNVQYHMKWFHDNWYISIYFSIAYLLFVYFVSKFMKTRERFDLRLPLTIWSLLLCLFSLCSTIRIVPELWHTFMTKGFKESVIDTSYRNDKRFVFWIWLFVWSKVPELGDTVFIILRKQKLIFLHWFHHFITLTYCFFAVHELAGNFRWTAGMNVTIHTAMYGYYALRAMRIRVPSFVNILITSSQLVQMFVGVAMHIIVIIERSKGVDVQFSVQGSIFGLLMYAGFLILFANFFIQSYLVPVCTSDKMESKLVHARDMNGNRGKKVE